MANTESDGPHAGTPSSSEVGGSPHGAPSLVSGTQKSPVQTNKLVINFDLQGNPIGPNKNRLLIRGLAIVKVIVGVVYDDWRKVPNGKKHEIWENLLQEFDIPAFHRENVLTQVQDQWKTWKKNIRKNYFGTTREEILMWKDNVPLKEGIPESDWNIFVEREATPQKLDQRAQSRVNRAKKKDVHTLGRKSYAQVAEEWAVCTRGDVSLAILRYTCIYLLFFSNSIVICRRGQRGQRMRVLSQTVSIFICMLAKRSIQENSTPVLLLMR